MRYGLHTVVFLFALASCSGSHEDESFLGTWRFNSGIRIGVSCFEKKMISEPWVGQEVTVTRDPNPQPNVGTRLVVEGFHVCSDIYWFVRGDFADFTGECMYAGSVGRPGAQIKNHRATLKVAGRTLTLINLTENESWVDKGTVAESCRFMTENAKLSYVGPATGQ